VYPNSEINEINEINEITMIFAKHEIMTSIDLGRWGRISGHGKSDETY